MPIYPYLKGGKEHYYYSFEVKDINGNRKTIKKRGFKGKTEARAAEREARVLWEKGMYIDPTKMTFGEYIQQWYENKQNINEHTRHSGDCNIRNHILPSLGNIPLNKINILAIEDFIKELQEKELSSGTINKVFTLVNTSLKAAVRKELISRNPIDLMDTKPTARKKQIDYWTKEEVKDFLEKCDNRLKILFVLAIYTGMRRGELLGLRWKDIDLENAQIRIRQTLGFKGKITDGAKTAAGNRSISISPFVVSELKKHRKMILEERLASEDYEDNDLVMCRPNGKQVSWGNFHKFWTRILEKTGARPIRFHDLRHTCASLLLQTPGVHPKVVQELLGHSSIKITLDTYSHLMPNMQAEAVKAMEEMLK